MSSDCCFLQEQRLTSHDRYGQHFRAQLDSNFIVMKINPGIFSRCWGWRCFIGRQFVAVPTFCVLVQIGNVILKLVPQSLLVEVKLKALL